MTEKTFSYETEPRGVMITLGVFIACAALVPSAIVAVQALTWRLGDPPLPTDPLSIVPGVLLALWGVWLATHHVRVLVDREARSLTWLSFAFGLRIRRVSWQATDIARIRITANAGVQPRGYSATVSGPRGTRTLRGYFHGWSAPKEVRDTARVFGVDIETQRR